jgi:3-hydroxyisobutyrate dehydrogenase-like beta-hydroxyacid dehydrogenase
LRHRRFSLIFSGYRPKSAKFFAMSVRTRKNVGVIGLGIIGQRVAENLRERGFHVFVWNRTPRPVPNFVGSAAEVAEICDFVQIFVSDDEALLQTVQRILPHLTAHHIIMAHSTVSPDTMRAAAEIVQRRNAQLLDAPFTGSKMAAQKGQLVYYVAGDPDALRQARPVLEASSKEIIEIGKVGDATTIKIATNMVTAATVQAAAEALALVYKSDLSPDKFAAAMRNNGSNSPTLEMKLPMMLEGNFEVNFSVKHMLKDVVIASRLARSFGLDFGATDAARHALAEEMRQGRGDDDYSSLFHQYYPAGGPLKSTQADSEDNQPTLAGIDEQERSHPGDSEMSEGTAIPAAVGVETGSGEPGRGEIAANQPEPALTDPLGSPTGGSGATVEVISDSRPMVVQEVRTAEMPAGSASSSADPETGKGRGILTGFWQRGTGD